MRSKILLAGNLLLFNFLILSCNTQPTENIILEIPKIINKSPEEVKELIGKPDSSIIQPIFNKKVLTYYYTEHVAEIRFFDNAASEIIIRNTEKIPFQESSLSYFGLEPTSPTEKRENLMLTWDNYENIKTISFYTKYRNEDGKPKVYEIFFKGK